MAIMGKPVWAVMCGAIRQEFEFLSALAMLCKYRADGVLDGIVISTWKGEPDNIPELRQKLEQLSVDVVELEPLDEGLGKYTDMSFARQAYQLRSGLDYIPDDVFVLKCRTDLIGHRIKDMENVLYGKADMTLGTHGAWTTSLNYRIAVCRLSLAKIFWFTDLTYIGYKADMYKMAILPCTVLEYGQFVDPDTVPFLYPFLSEYPIFGEILRLTKNGSMLLHSNVLVRRLKAYYSSEGTDPKDFALPGAFNKLFAMFFVILENCFYPYAPTKKIKELYLYDIFSTNKKVGMVNDDVRDAMIDNREILHMVTAGECVPTEGYLKLYREINRIRWPGYAHGMYLTEEDYLETYAWVRDVLKLDPNKELSWSGAKASNAADIDFAKAVDILYSDKHTERADGEALHIVLKDICFNYKRNFFWSIVDNYQRIKAIDQNAYANAVGASSRVRVPIVLEKIAKDLYYSRIEPQYEEAYRFIFERHKKNMMLMKCEFLSGLYYYAKYSLNNGDDTYAKKLYDYLLKFAKSGVSPESGSYLDAAVDILKKIVNARYQEVAEDPDIRNIVDFMYDEFGKGAFSGEALQCLSGHLAEREYARPFSLGERRAYGHLLDDANRVEGQEEAECISRLLLREFSSQTEQTQSAAAAALNDLCKRFSMPRISALLVALQGVEQTGACQIGHIEDDDDFVIFLRLLYAKKRIADNRQMLCDLCEGKAYRYFVLAIFEKLERTPDIRFFSVKPHPTGAELWFNHAGYMRTNFDGKLLDVHNRDWVAWPYAEAASRSDYAAFLSLKQGRAVLMYQAKLSAEKNDAKERLLSLYKERSGATVDPQDRLALVANVSYPVADSPELIGEAVNAALDSFCEIGWQLAACAETLADEPFPPVKDALRPDEPPEGDV